MARLWEWVDKQKLSDESKSKVFLFLNSLIYTVLGFVVWTVVSRFALDTWDWAFCFAGYPGFFIGYIGGFIFLCRR